MLLTGLLNSDIKKKTASLIGFQDIHNVFLLSRFRRSSALQEDPARKYTLFYSSLPEVFARDLEKSEESKFGL